MTETGSSQVSYRFKWVVPEGATESARPILEEIVRRGRRNEDLGDHHWNQRNRWVALNYVLGAPGAILAGISGTISLSASGQDVTAGILALASAGLGGLLAFLNPTVRAADAAARANSYWRISAWVRRAVAADLPGADEARARRVLLEIEEREEALLGGA